MTAATCARCAYFRGDDQGKSGWCYVEPMQQGVPSARPACRHFVAPGSRGGVAIKFPDLPAQQEAQLPAIAKELSRGR